MAPCRRRAFPPRRANSRTSPPPRAGRRTTAVGTVRSQRRIRTPDTSRSPSDHKKRRRRVGPLSRWRPRRSPTPLPGWWNRQLLRLPAWPRARDRRYSRRWRCRRLRRRWGQRRRSSRVSPGRRWNCTPQAAQAGSARSSCEVPSPRRLPPPPGGTCARRRRASTGRDR
jgi:hypothetical protein